MGAGIPGLGGIGGALGGLVSQTWRNMQGNALQAQTQQYQMQTSQADWRAALQQAWLHQRQATFPKVSLMPPAPVDKLTLEETIIREPNAKWLHARIESTRERGKEWMTVGRHAPPPKVDKLAAQAGTTAGTGIPIKRLANGDYVYVYPEGHHIPPEVLAKWQAMEKLKAEKMMRPITTNFYDWGGV